jgi:hypothetical protein
VIRVSTHSSLEARLAIKRRVCDSQQRFRVIPFLLRRVKRNSLPALLVNTTWLEFHGSIDDLDAFRRLVGGIRGIVPGPGGRDTLGSPRTPTTYPLRQILL